MTASMIVYPASITLAEVRVTSVIGIGFIASIAQQPAGGTGLAACGALRAY